MSMPDAPLGYFDCAIVIIYVLAVVGLGVTAGCLLGTGEIGGEGGHYSLAGNTLVWPVIGLAMVAANISTVHLVSLPDAAYEYGPVFGSQNPAGIKSFSPVLRGTSYPGLNDP